MSKISLEGNVSGSGTLTIAAPNTNSNFTLTLPTETGTIITNSGNQAGSFTTLNTSGAVVFNDAGADVDFRVEGDTDANLLFVDASADKVGIGTSSPTAKVHISQSGASTSLNIDGIENPIFATRYAANADGATIFLAKSRNATIGSQTIVQNGDQVGVVQARGSNGTNFIDAASIVFAVDGTPGAGNDMPGRIVFNTTPDGSGSLTERMRIDSSGNVGVGTTAPSGYAPFTVAKAAFNVNIGQICAASLSASDAGITGMSVWKTDATTSASQIFIKFIINNGSNGSGQINADGANQAAFGSYSDRRLKENIVGLEAQLANICALRPVEFDYIKSEGGGHQVGFVAQEMQEVYPDAVGERQPDGMLTVTGWSKTEARLVKAIQELKAELDSAKEANAALEARITAIENGA